MILNMLRERVRAFYLRSSKIWTVLPHVEVLHDLLGVMIAHSGDKDRPLRLGRYARELVENALAFGELVADDVAVPRADIVAIPEKSKFSKVVSMFAKTYHSRLPVMGHDMDDLKGFVLLKDVVAYVGKEDTFQVSDILRPLTFVPETLPLPKVLQVMRRAKVPFVMVADEFGGVSGLISLKDILERLVGNMDDENVAHDEALVSLGQNRYRARGDIELTQLDRVLGTRFCQLAGDDVVTLGGLVMQVAHVIPAKGEHVALGDGWLITVVETDGRRILRVDVERTS